MPQNLGQHFLKNQIIQENIAKELKLSPQDIIFEIGGGEGDLTKAIVLKMGAKNKLIVIEKDTYLATNLKNQFSSNKQITIIEGDARYILESTIIKYSYKKAYKIIGNIPYYATGIILRLISEFKHKPILTILTLQREVAERLVAKDGHATLFSTIINFWAKPNIIFNISKNSFVPPPKVESSLLVLKTSLTKDVKFNDFIKIVKILFKQPRKTIYNNLRAFYPTQEIEGLNKLLLARRPQTLSQNDIKKLLIHFSKNNKLLNI